MNADGSHGWFMRAAAVIGDLSNLFYQEERQRDVWNEASAVALQVLLWLSWLAASAAVWIIGAPAVSYAWTMIAIIAIAGWIAVLYARPSRFRRPRSSSRSSPRCRPRWLLQPEPAAQPPAGDREAAAAEQSVLMGSAVNSGAAHRRAWWTRRAAALRRQWSIC